MLPPCAWTSFSMAWQYPAQVGFVKVCTVMPTFTLGSAELVPSSLPPHPTIVSDMQQSISPVSIIFMGFLRFVLMD